MRDMEETLKVFIDEIPTEDFMHLKHTMSSDEVDAFLSSWIEKYEPILRISNFSS